MNVRDATINYNLIERQSLHDNCRQMAVRELCKQDLFYLLVYGLHRVDANNQWVYDRCQEYQAAPDGYLDLWWREGYKSTIVTFAGIIQGLMNDPERTYGIFSHTRPAAKKFLRQIKVELETNEALKEIAPEEPAAEVEPTPPTPPADPVEQPADQDLERLLKEEIAALNDGNEELLLEIRAKIEEAMQ